jgi:hypothetical protein
LAGANRHLPKPTHVTDTYNTIPNNSKSNGALEAIFSKIGSFFGLSKRVAMVHGMFM